jgi:hypothetical protein
MRDQTLLFVDFDRLDKQAGRTFRSIPSEVEPIVANLSIANMDFHEYADHADPDTLDRRASLSGARMSAMSVLASGSRGSSRVTGFRAGRLSAMADEGWYAVRCVFRLGRPEGAGGKAYEERITLWRADSFEHAIERAEAEAVEYASTGVGASGRYLRLAQAYLLYDVPGDGAEIFSLIRESKRKPRAYLDRFFDTGAERQRSC